MGAFFDGCKQFSDIPVPFMDTLVTGNIRSENTPFLQLMDDLHPLCMDYYLHNVDSAFVLACETRGIAKQSLTWWVHKLKDVRKFLILWMLMIAITISLLVQKMTQMNFYPLTLNTKVTCGKSIQFCKIQLEKTRFDVTNYMVDSIRDQVDSCTLMCQFSAFDLKSSEDLNGGSQKISALYNTFGSDAEHI